MYLTALQAFADERFEFASERFREAARKGLREPKLAPLIGLSLVRAGEKLLFEDRDSNRADVPATEAAEPAAIDPAAVSASIAEMMVRLIRMSPPGRPYWSAACRVPHQLIGAAELSVSYCQCLAFMH